MWPTSNCTFCPVPLDVIHYCTIPAPFALTEIIKGDCGEPTLNSRSYLTPDLIDNHAINRLCGLKIVTTAFGR
jgi:hypothetical protein